VTFLGTTVKSKEVHSRQSMVHGQRLKSKQVHSIQTTVNSKLKVPSFKLQDEKLQAAGRKSQASCLMPHASQFIKPETCDIVFPETWDLRHETVHFAAQVTGCRAHAENHKLNYSLGISHCHSGRTLILSLSSFISVFWSSVRIVHSRISKIVAAALRERISRSRTWGSSRSLAT